MRDISSSYGFAGRALPWLLTLLVISAAYLYTLPQANVFYAVIVLLHALTGVVTAILLVPAIFRFVKNGSFLARTGWTLVAEGVVLGGILIEIATTRAELR